MKTLIAAVFLIGASITSAQSDQLDAANFRNAVELGAFVRICKGQASDLARSYRDFATETGFYTRQQIDKAIRQRASEAKKNT